MSRNNIPEQATSTIVFIIFAIIGFIAVTFIYSTYSVKVTGILVALQCVAAFAVGLFAASISVPIVRKYQSKKK